VALTLGSGQLKLSGASGEYGEATDELMVETRGAEAKIGFNSQYLLDFLSVAGAAKVRLEMKDENLAARLVICPDPEDKSALNYQYVIMPMRLLAGGFRKVSGPLSSHPEGTSVSGEAGWGGQNRRSNSAERPKRAARSPKRGRGALSLNR